MPLLYDVIFASRCTSTHHRLAVDALRYLSGPDAETWRNLFLHWYAPYLKGAKAPDDTFKDFKNHVCHPRDKFWGGAPAAAEAWYAKTVSALAAKDWPRAAFNAGVTSHYIADPLQPFHTAQSEAENAIHRAVEQSFAKSYTVLQQVLEARGGYGAYTLPSGPGWLAQTVRAGAEAAHPLYETIIDHYDFKRGAKDPPAGLDDTLREAIAPLIGRAAITIARVLDRAFAEAGAKPARFSPSLDAFFAQMGAPIAQIARKLADDKERALVLAMYKEFTKTGKVAKTLPADDRAVRAHYASEVLNVPLAQLDKEKPRAIGAAHGAPLSARAKAAKPAPAKAPPEPKPKKTAPAKMAPAAKKTRKKTKAAPAYDPSSPFAVLAPGGALDKAAHVHEAEEPLLDPPPAPPPPPGVRLHREDLIIDAPAVGPKAAARFEAIGYKTVADLLDASPDDAAKSLRASHMTAPIIRDWQAQALLAVSVPNVRSVDAQALVACGVRDLETLARREAKTLAAAIDNYLKTPAGKNIARSSKPPALDVVKAWIEAARTPPKAERPDGGKTARRAR